MKTLVTICARGGSKGLPGKNIKPLMGLPLIAHTIKVAQEWSGAEKILVSTDSADIAKVAEEYGAEVPFLRPSQLATDQSGKLPVLTHALNEAEKRWGTFDLVVDLDPTNPLRAVADIENGVQTYSRHEADVCFSVVKARKNPYFNIVERDDNGTIRLVKSHKAVSRQAAPEVWDINGAIYVYRPDFLRSGPQALWDGQCEIFEMPALSAFDIDTERDFRVVECLLQSLKSEG